MSINLRTCPNCNETMREDCFRKGAKTCVWCTFASMTKRASARYVDKAKLATDLLQIAKCEFIAWYEQQPDCCAYCGLTFDELKRLRIRRRGGYCVAWDIDRVDASRPYIAGNLALSCFVCNMAKGDMLTAEEARTIGKVVRQIWNARLLEGNATQPRDDTTDSDQSLAIGCVDKCSNHSVHT